MIIANRLTILNASNSQTLFFNHKRHLFIANLNNNNDSQIGKHAGNRLSRSDVIRPNTKILVNSKFDSNLKWLLHFKIRSWLIYFYNRCHENMKLRVLQFESPSVYMADQRVLYDVIFRN